MWKTVKDKVSGDNYYWNSNTDEVTWEKPDELRHKRSTTNNFNNASDFGASSCPRPAVPPSVPARSFPTETPASEPFGSNESSLRSAPAVPARTFGSADNDDDTSSDAGGFGGAPSIPSRSRTLRNSRVPARPEMQGPASSTLGRPMPSRPPAGRPKFPTNAFGTRPRLNTPTATERPAIPERSTPAAPAREVPAVPERSVPDIPSRSPPVVPERPVPDVPASNFDDAPMDDQDNGGEYHIFAFPFTYSHFHSHVSCYLHLRPHSRSCTETLETCKRTDCRGTGWRSPTLRRAP